MEYSTIFDPVPWNEVATGVLQTVVIFWFIILGLKLVGRRVFGEMGPQDLVLLLLVAEATDLGLTPEKAGFWGSLASAGTLLAVGAFVERIPLLRQRLEEKKVVLFEDGHPIRSAMENQMIDDADLEKATREYGMGNLDAFESLVLESDGKITGVLKPEYRGRIGKISSGTPGH